MSYDPDVIYMAAFTAGYKAYADGEPNEPPESDDLDITDNGSDGWDEAAADTIEFGCSGD